MNKKIPINHYKQQQLLLINNLHHVLVLIIQHEQVVLMKELQNQEVEQVLNMVEHIRIFYLMCRKMKEKCG
jgi:hypothetical protein